MYSTSFAPEPISFPYLLVLSIHLFTANGILFFAYLKYRH